MSCDEFDVGLVARCCDAIGNTQSPLGLAKPSPSKTPIRAGTPLKAGTPKAAAAASAAAIKEAKRDEANRPASVRAMEETVRDSTSVLDRQCSGSRLRLSPPLPSLPPSLLHALLPLLSPISLFSLSLLLQHTYDPGLGHTCTIALSQNRNFGIGGGAGIRMATIQYVSAMSPLEAAIKQWDASYRREIEGLQAKIRSLEAQVEKKENVTPEGSGSEGVQGGTSSGLTELKRSFMEGVETGEAGAWEVLLREKEEEIKTIRQEATRYMTEKQAGGCREDRVTCGSLFYFPACLRE